MKLPAVQGIIRRRMLVNFRADPEVTQRLLPPPFRPKLHRGSAIAGICLIRLEQIRPEFVRLPVGAASENAAHRVAVLWTDKDGAEREGVYIPRRDTSSLFNHLAGGCLFPGEHEQAHFRVCDEGGVIDFAMRSADGTAEIRLRGRESDALPATSRFASLPEASSFFEGGSFGYSATQRGDRLDGIRLETQTWHVTPLDVESVYSSFFADEGRFPPGTVQFDCALLMRDIPHHWFSLPALDGAAFPAAACR